MDPLMAHISYSSGEWWQRIMETVRKSYEAWLTEDPLGRLRLKVETPKNALAWPRTEKSALAMLLYNHCLKSFGLRWWRPGNWLPPSSCSSCFACFNQVVGRSGQVCLNILLSSRDRAPPKKWLQLWDNGCAWTELTNWEKFIRVQDEWFPGQDWFPSGIN